MVLYDDKKWLCRLIRTAFTIEDDSGICEKTLKEKPHLGGNVNHDDSDTLSSDDSFDIREGSDLSHRRRSNTAIRLERLEKQRKAQTETQNVRLHNVEYGKNDFGFSKDESFKEKKKDRSSQIVSINKLLQSVPHPDKIPYAQYTKFESSCHPSSPSKKISIFLTFLPQNKRAYPLKVVVIYTAKVYDLIGLILWKTSQNYPGIELHPVHHYNLQIADDDGEWDSDFPCLDHGEPISKFSFAYLALVRCEHVSHEFPRRPKLSFSFLLPDGTTYKTTPEDLEITLGQMVKQVLNKSGWNKRIAASSFNSGTYTLGYHLEKLGDATIKFTDPSLTLSNAKCKDFCLVRDGAKSYQSGTGACKRDYGGSGTVTEMPSGRSDLYPVIVSTGRFNKLKNALCVIWGGERMDLEFQNKTKSYPLNAITGVKFDQTKNRIVISISQLSSTGVGIGGHYLTNTGHITLTTNELRISTELYHHLNSIIVLNKN